MEYHYNFTEGQPGQAGPQGSPQDPGPKEKKKKEKKERKMGLGTKVLIAVATALLCGVLAGAAFVGTSLLGSSVFGLRLTQSGSVQEGISQGTTALNTSVGTVTSDFSDVVDRCMPSLVSITNMSVQEVQGFFGQTGVREAESSGSGIIIAQNDEELLIVTNEHVISGYETLTVSFVDNTSAEASLKGSDPVNDVAVISVPMDAISQETKDAIAIATLGDSTQLQVGEPVLAIGNALGYGQTVTSGIVSALDRDITDTEGQTMHNLIQTDAAINPGNSGGALINALGQVVGINTAKASSTEVEGTGYAISISNIQGILEELMNQETRVKLSDTEKGYLGIEGLDVTSEVTQRYGMPAGAFVSSVQKGYGADEAGIQQGSIITAVNGTAVEDMQDLQEALRYYGPGETVEVTLQVPDASGEYQEQTVSVTLSKQPE